jgi:hypothetical protein
LGLVRVARLRGNGSSIVADILVACVVRVTRRPAATVALFAVLAALAGGWAATTLRLEGYEEDGLLESATAVVLLVCASLLASGIRRADAIDRRLGVGVTTLAIVCFLLLMEEISWGQRILGFETPDEIGQINAQQETNLHSMFVGYNQLIRLAIALVIATVLIDRARWVGWLRLSGLDRLMPPAAAIYFVPFLLYAHTYDELFEEVVGLFLLVYVIDLRRRLRCGA